MLHRNLLRRWVDESYNPSQPPRPLRTLTAHIAKSSGPRLAAAAIAVPLTVPPRRPACGGGTRPSRVKPI
jgi:hypothetical protein